LNKEKAKAKTLELGKGVVAKNLQEILDDKAVQIVSIASNDDDHAAEVLQCLKAGKHIFVEKPLCRTEKELLAIKKAWQNKGGKLKLSSNLVLRGAELYQWLKKEIESDKFGEIYSFDAEYLYGRIQKITEGWRKDITNYSVMEGGGVHLIDLLSWITSQRPMKVSTIGTNLATQGTAFKYNDYMAASFKFTSGMIGRVTANFGCVHRHHHVIKIFGTKATFIYDDQGARIHKYRDEDKEAEPIKKNPLPTGKGILIPEFITAIEKDLDWTQDTQEHFDAISICAASDTSLKQEKEVEIYYV
jgi:predicted dehydrogenase